jgi:GNAT superfamily N-acetyltransferase
MCGRFWEHTLFDEPFDSEHTRTMVEMALEHGLLAVVDLDGLVGFVAGVKSFLIGSKEAMYGTELAWWIEPEHRKGRLGIDLMLTIEEMAKSEGIKYWTMASMESSNPEVSNKIYSRLGYKKSETYWTKVL